MGNRTQQQKHPILLLQDIEFRSRKYAAGLPQQEEVKDEWLGIGFSVGKHRMVAPMGHVTEILNFPNLSRVPGAKPWVLGIANVRGNLLPVMDLNGYLNGHNTQVRKKSRIMVLSHDGVVAGLLVDDVLGLRHFVEEDRMPGLPDADVAVRPYLEHAYASDDDTWMVFNMRKLAESPLFMQVAV